LPMSVVNSVPSTNSIPLSVPTNHLSMTSIVLSLQVQS
jgi:hypothetical protein